MGDPRISLCMIVKDEAEMLPRCLEAVSPFVDEMIIVDTGSTDGTPEIAEGYGAKVVHEPWRQSFAAARNRSIEEASGDWLIILDADEVLSPDAGRSLREISKDESCLGMWLPVNSVLEKKQEVKVLLTRVVRRREDIRFRYRIHEQILPDINRLINEGNGWTMRVMEGEAYHDGYLPERREEKNKTARNEALFLKQIEDTPDDLYVLYMYADFVRRYKHEDSEALEILEKAYAVMSQVSEAELREYTFTGELCGLLGMMLYNSGERDRAWEITSKAVSQCRPSAHLLFVHGRMALHRKDGVTAERMFRGCLDMGKGPMLIPAQVQVTGAAARLGIAQALVLQERHAEASPMAWQAVSDELVAPEAIGVWADIQMAMGKWGLLTDRLIERVQAHPNCGTTWFKGGESLCRLKLFEKALPWLLRASELLEEPACALAMAGQSLILVGLHEAAVDAFNDGLPDKRCEAGLMAMAIAYDLELDAPLDPADEILVSEFQNLLLNLDAMGEDRLAGLFDEARERIASFDPMTRSFLEKALYPRATDAPASAPSTAPQSQRRGEQTRPAFSGGA